MLRLLPKSRAPIPSKQVIGQLIPPDFEEEAKRLLEDARRQAASMLAAARQEAGAIKQAAYNEGYAAGLARGGEIGIEQGRERGLEEVHALFQQRAEKLLEALRNLETAVAAQRARTARRLKEEALELFIRAAEYLARRSVELDRVVAAAVLQDAVDYVSSRPARVFFNPRDLKDIGEFVPEVIERFQKGGEPAWLFLEDEALAPGDVRIEHPEGRLDLSFEQRLAILRSALLGEGAANAV